MLVTFFNYQKKKKKGKRKEKDNESSTRKYMNTYEVNVDALNEKKEPEGGVE